MIQKAIRNKDGEYESNFNLFDAAERPFLDIGNRKLEGVSPDVGNHIVSSLLSSLEGKTLFLTPNDSEVSRNGLSGIGIRVFEGKNGLPNLVYAPMVDSGNKGIGGGNAAGAVATALRMKGQANETVKKQIRDFAAKINSSLDPVLMAQSIVDRHFPDSIQRGERKEKGEPFDLSEIDEITEMLNLIPAEAREGRDFKAAITNHFLKVSAKARKLGVNANNFRDLGIMPQLERDFASDILLVSEVLTNPKLKELFDEAYIDGETTLNDTQLPAWLELALMTEITSLSGVVTGDGQTEAGGQDASVSDENLEEAQKRAFSLAERAESDMEVGDYTEFYEDENLGLSVGEQLGAESLQSLNELVDDLGDAREIDDIHSEMARKRNDKVVTNKIATNDHFASDNVSFNFLASLVESGMIAQGAVMPQPQGGVDALKRGAKDIRVAGKDKSTSLPMVGSNATADEKATKIYVGELRNLTQSKAKGSTALNVAFHHTRIQNINASLINQTKESRDYIRSLAVIAINNEIEENPFMARELAEFNPILAMVRITDTFVAQLGDVLPDGDLQKAIDHAVAGHQNLKDKKTNLIQQSNFLNKAIQQLEEFEPERYAAQSKADTETGEMVGLASQKLAEIFKDHKEILISEDMSAGRSIGFLSKVIKTAFMPGSKGFYAVNTMGHTLNELRKAVNSRDSLINDDFPTGYNLGAATIEDVNQLIDELITTYNFDVGVVNKRIDHSFTNARKFAGLGNNPVSLKRLHLRELDNPKDVSGNLIEKLDDARKHFSKESRLAKKMANDGKQAIADSFGSELISSFSTDGAKGSLKLNRKTTSRLFRAGLKAFQKATEGNEAQAVQEWLEAEMNKSGKPGVTMKDLVSHLVLSTEKATEMIKDRVRDVETTETLQRWNQQLNWVKTEQGRVDAALEAYDDGSKSLDNKIGRTHFVEEVPLMDDKGNLGNPIRRQIGVNLLFAPPRSFTPKMKEEGSEEAIAEEQRRRLDFVLKRNGIRAALTKFSTEQVDDAYKIVKRAGDNYAEFDPVSMIEESVSMIKLDTALTKRTFDRAISEAQLAEERGMTIDALAMLTDPASSEFDVISGTKKKRSKSQKREIKKLRMPANFAARAEKIGRYMSLDGEAIILLPTNAKEQLMKLHPKTVNKKNVRSQVKNITLAAIEYDKGEGESDSLENIKKGYFFEALSDLKKDSFSMGDDFDLTKDKGLSAEDAATVFTEEYERKIQIALNSVRNAQNGSTKVKEVDLTGPIAAAEVRQYTFFIKQIVMSLNSEALIRKPKLREEVAKFVKMIEDEDVKPFYKTEGENHVSFTNIGEFNVEDTFAKVFSAIEGEEISKRLALGLTVSDGGTNVWLMKHIHHQDARIRNNFRNSYVARQAAQHLVSFLDQGMGGFSGRAGHETAKKAAEKKIGEAAQDVSGGRFGTSDNLNHTLGYVIAMLNGLQNSNGQSLTTSLNSWMTAMKTGFKQNKAFVDKAKTVRGNAVMEALKLGDVSRYLTGSNIDLIRDFELAEKIRSILNESGIARKILAAKEEVTSDDVTAGHIEELKQFLLSKVENNKKAEVENYSNVISDVFADIDSAMHFAVAMTATSRDESTRATISSTPMRLAYAANPTSKERPSGGKFVEDPLESVRITDSSFFGGNVTSDHSYQSKDVYRPIAINGISSPLSLVGDSIYRLNVAPTYGVMRKVLGKVEIVNNVPTIDINDSEILKVINSDTPDQGDYETKKEYNEAFKDYRNLLKDTQTSLAAIASEYETVLQNDFQRGVVDTGGSEIMRILGSFYIVRALASVQQLWDQTSGPSIGYTAGKIASGNAKSAALYWKLLGKMLTSKDFRHRVKNFIQVTEPHVFYRAADGQDVAKDQMKGQKRYGRSKVKSTAGKLIRSIESSGEKVLDATIGTGERILAASVYLSELAQETGVYDAEAIMSGVTSDGKKVAIGTQEKKNALTKVNDMMGQSDQAKKGWFFQTRDKNPALNALWKSIVRFSNHTSSLSSNTAVMSRVMYGEAPKGVSEADWQRNQQEARENVITSLVQNTLFYPLKIKTLLPVMLYFIFKAGDDDDDEAAEHAQEVANDILVKDEDGNKIANMIKTLAFGRQREAFQLDGDIDDAQASLMAEIMSRSALEVASAVPALGSLAGYSPVQGFLAKAFTNDMASSVAATITNNDRKDVYVRSYQADAAEKAFDMTTPSSVVYDYAEATKLIIDYGQTRDFARNPAMGVFDQVIYAMTEILPFLREAKGQMRFELKEEVKKLPKNR